MSFPDPVDLGRLSYCKVFFCSDTGIWCFHPGDSIRVLFLGGWLSDLLWGYPWPPIRGYFTATAWITWMETLPKTWQLTNSQVTRHWRVLWMNWFTCMVHLHGERETCNVLKKRLPSQSVVYFWRVNCIEIMMSTQKLLGPSSHLFKSVIPRIGRGLWVGKLRGSNSWK